MKFLNCLGLLVLRVVLGVIMVVHGIDKLFTKSPSAIVEMFTNIGIPNPEIFAWVAILVELLGGIALVVGLLTRLAALGIGLVIGGAIYYVHLANGFFNTEGGFEYQLLITAASAALVLTGPGYISLDKLIFRRKKAVVTTENTGVVSTNDTTDTDFSPTITPGYGAGTATPVVTDNTTEGPKTY